MKKKILLIDDEADFCFFTKKNLERIGSFEVVIENDPSRGVAVAEAESPDMIFLDIIMPNIDGSEVAYRLENNAKTKHIPIVFLTCLAEEKDVATGSVGGRKFVAKPCQIADLIEAIKQTIGE